MFACTTPAALTQFVRDPPYVLPTSEYPRDAVTSLPFFIGDHAAMNERATLMVVVGVFGNMTELVFFGGVAAVLRRGTPFDAPGEDWTHVQYLREPNGLMDAFDFATSVALSADGDVLVLTEPAREIDSGTGELLDAGRVHVYLREPDWTFPSVPTVTFYPRTAAGDVAYIGDSDLSLHVSRDPSTNERVCVVVVGGAAPLPGQLTLGTVLVYASEPGSDCTAFRRTAELRPFSEPGESDPLIQPGFGTRFTAAPLVEGGLPARVVVLSEYERPPANLNARGVLYTFDVADGDARNGTWVASSKKLPPLEGSIGFGLGLKLDGTGQTLFVPLTVFTPVVDSGMLVYAWNATQHAQTGQGWALRDKLRCPTPVLPTTSPTGFETQCGGPSGVSRSGRTVVLGTSNHRSVANGPRMAAVWTWRKNDADGAYVLVGGPLPMPEFPGFTGGRARIPVGDDPSGSSSSGYVPITLTRYVDEDPESSYAGVVGWSMGGCPTAAPVAAAPG